MHPNNRPLNNFDEIAEYASRMITRYAPTVLYNRSKEEYKDFTQDCLEILCKYREKAEREIKYTGQLYYWCNLIMRGLSSRMCTHTSTEKVTANRLKKEARYISYSTTEDKASLYREGSVNKQSTGGGIEYIQSEEDNTFGVIELKERLYYLNKLLDAELLENTMTEKVCFYKRNGKMQKVKYIKKGKKLTSYSIMTLNGMGYTREEISEILGKEISIANLSQITKNARLRVQELRANPNDLESLWLHKKLLVKAGEKEELSIYKGFSTDEILGYCDRMVERIKQENDNEKN